MKFVYRGLIYQANSSTLIPQETQKLIKFRGSNYPIHNYFALLRQPLKVLKYRGKIYPQSSLIDVSYL